MAAPGVGHSTARFLVFLAVECSSQGPGCLARTHSAVRFFDLCFLVSLGFLLWGGAVKGGAGALEMK